MHVRNIYIRVHANIASAALLEHCVCSHCEAAQAHMWNDKASKLSTQTQVTMY